MRTYHKKRRSGCLTCKARHVKCDERRPTCQNCERVGRDCEGYTDVLAVSRTRAPVAFRGFRNTLYPSQALTTRKGTAQQNRAIEFFNTVTLPDIKKLLVNSSWPDLLQGDMNIYHPLWQSCAAVAAIHEAATFEESALMREVGTGRVQPSRTLAMSEYLAAVTSLRSEIERGTIPRHVVLFTCLMFIIFESITGNTESMLMHLRNAVALLAEHTEETRNEAETEASELIQTINTMYGLYELHRSRTLPEPYLLDEVEDPSEENLDTASVEAATSGVNNTIFQRIFHFCWTAILDAYPGDVDVGSEQASLQEVLSSWKAALETSTSEDAEHSMAIRARFEMALISVEASPERLQVAFDKHLPGFTRILQYIQTLVASDQQQSAFSTSQRFSLDTGIISVLYFVAHRCRHPRMRREAVQLLSSVPGHDGFWDATVAAEAANTIITFEERHLKADSDLTNLHIAVPEEQRIHDATITDFTDFGQSPQLIQVQWRPMGPSSPLENASIDIHSGAFIEDSSYGKRRSTVDSSGWDSIWRPYDK